jgi:hypothetical protein
VGTPASRPNLTTMDFSHACGCWHWPRKPSTGAETHIMRELPQDVSRARDLPGGQGHC